jgi:hypothetical protein
VFLSPQYKLIDMTNLRTVSALLVSIILMSASCKSTKTTTESASAQTQEVEKETQLLVSLKRTPCYGKCPTYRIYIKDNGQLVYEGKRFVEKLGTYEGMVSSVDVENIQNKIREMDYFSLEDAYDVPISDFPTCVTSVNLDGKQKSIMNKQDAPASLRSFEKYLDSLIDGLELKKVSDEIGY